MWNWPRSRGAFLLRLPWHPASMRILIAALCLLVTPALADVAGVATVIDPINFCDRVNGLTA